MQNIIPFEYESTRYDARVPDEKHLYVAEIKGHGVKIGITADPETRMKSHARDASAFGYELGRVWVSIPHRNASTNEALLKRHYNSTREYIDTSYEDAVQEATHTPRQRSDQAKYDQHANEVLGIFQSVVLGSAL